MRTVGCAIGLPEHMHGAADVDGHSAAAGRCAACLTRVVAGEEHAVHQQQPLVPAPRGGWDGGGHTACMSPQRYAMQNLLPCALYLNTSAAKRVHAAKWCKHGSGIT